MCHARHSPPPLGHHPQSHSCGVQGRSHAGCVRERAAWLEMPCGVVQGRMQQADLGLLFGSVWSGHRCDWLLHMPPVTACSRLFTWPPTSPATWLASAGNRQVQRGLPASQVMQTPQFCTANSACSGQQPQRQARAHAHDPPVRHACVPSVPCEELLVCGAHA